MKRTSVVKEQLLLNRPSFDPKFSVQSDGRCERAIVGGTTRVNVRFMLGFM